MLTFGGDASTVLFERSNFKKWVKLVPIEKTVIFDNYENKEYFTPVANIVRDDDYIGECKKRNTVIKFEPLISKKEFSCRDEWLYLITINNHIVKLGGTRTGLKGRIGSYLCGHHITERNKSGDCSKTNAYIYNTIDFYLNLNCEIKMFGYKLPKVTTVVQILDKKVDIVVQTYHAYESTFLFNFKTNYGFFPYLSDNCDPEYS